MLAAIAKFTLCPILPMLFCACSAQSIPQQSPQSTVTATPQKPQPSANLEPHQSIAQMKQVAYPKGLKSLTRILQRNPQAKPVIQSLLNHPKQAFEIFDGNYRCHRSYPFNKDVPDSDNRDDERRIANYFQDFPNDIAGNTRIYKTASDKYLMMTTCLVGPYWMRSVNYLYTLTDPPTVKRLTLKMFGMNEKTNQVFQVQSEFVHGVSQFDEQKQEYRLRYKFSGMGNCGFAGTYRLENDELVLQEFRAQWDCNRIVRPTEYPRIYP